MFQVLIRISPPRVFRGTIDDCELVEGLVLTQRVANSSVTRVEKAKIGLIQFCLSPPKTDVSHLINITYNKYSTINIYVALYTARGKSVFLFKRNKVTICKNYIIELIPIAVKFHYDALNQTKYLKLNLFIFRLVLNH